MKKTIRTFLKSAEKDKIARSANPAIVRASTIYFKTMQEMRKHQKKITKGKKSKGFHLKIDGKCFLRAS